MEKCSNPVLLNNSGIDCLMYADDIVLLSDSKDGLQKRIDELHELCNKWCLTGNLTKTKIVIFNRSGKLLNNNLLYNDHTIECVKSYKYLGITLSCNGNFKQCKDILYQKSLKACFKLQKISIFCKPKCFNILTPL